LQLPVPLRGIFFDKMWETSRIWALPTPASLLRLDQLVWHMDLTVWTTVPGEPRFDLAPAAVLQAPGEFPRHWHKIHAADLGFPLELFQNGPRWVIVDGYHRLCGHVLRNSSMVPVRLHASAYWESCETSTVTGG
jgi:hypothetical protein